VSEPVIITPLAGRDTSGDPLPLGDPFTLYGLVAPGNTTRTYQAGGDLEEADFTIHFPARVRREADGEWGWAPVASLLPDDFTVEVRGQVCDGRAQVWDEAGRGGVVVLASSATGRAA
jgi:hypothetical protein